VVDELKQAAGSTAHAFLLKGPSGSGLQDLAVMLATMRICPDRGCFECPECRAAESLTHLDLKLASGSELKAETLRALLMFAVLSPEHSVNKAVIVDGLDRLGGLAPMLLKTVEEPPVHTTWIFTANSITPDMLPIASRCYQINVGSPSQDEVRAEVLNRGFEPTNEVMELLNGRLDRIDLIGAIPDWSSYLAKFAQLPSLVKPDPSWLAQLAFELIPTSDTQLNRQILIAGLEVCLRNNPSWLDRIGRALEMLERNISIRLVLTWLVFGE
jgi:hypothetical protein